MLVLNESTRKYSLPIHELLHDDYHGIFAQHHMVSFMTEHSKQHHMVSFMTEHSDILYEIHSIDIMGCNTPGHSITTITW